MRRFILALAMAAGLATPALAQGTIRIAVGTSLNELDLSVCCSASEDLKTWAFKLREGVKFHHGKTFDAEDVLATMNRILDPATGSRARANLSMIEKIEAPDPTTVRFTLNIPYAGFPDIFGERQLRILAKDRIDAISKSRSARGRSCSGPGRRETASNSRRIQAISSRGCRSST